MSNKTIKPLISAEELLTISQNNNLVLIDTRMGKDIKATYLENHLKGALHVNLNNDLSDIKENLANGGRHPLPSIEKFSKVITNLGISPDSHVVIYDDKSAAIASARLWWMLTAIGHKNVQVLNGGLKEAIKVGYPTSSGEETPVKVPLYVIDKWKLPMKTMNEVEKISQDKDYLVIDVRAKERYNGEVEPIDLIAGHIPGATNIPFTSTNLDENGLYLESSILKKKYEKIIGSKPLKNVTVHCGSGVTACHTLLAMAHAEIEIPNLYVGSWSEWSRNNKTIATNLNE
ncbi:thiosulfate/3-mercaptopyruvate sulfurtransferase [Maribacter vaceletii]|uniref:Thiosulfate/3-mercaptopyruvate sulfurtransferase n=1 Tax=Maribacter vaceletii TaxID=1206816 RepID=A0A495EEC7_9FLAO|nr:sulfurtransferase [Maribacter vaceletii]RKR15248.1 thiosulfate/3-mercaptopyruvate sulfurtransferase [Maribacter vaceletii]